MSISKESFVLDTKSSQLLRERAATYRITKSEALRRATRLWLHRTNPPICPFCESNDRVFKMDGVWHCHGCGEAFATANDNGADR